MTWSRHPHPGQKYRHGWIPVPGKALADLLVSQTLYADASRVFGGRFGRLDVRVTSAELRDGRLHIAATLHDRKGRQVGGIRRVVGPGRDGRLVAEHAMRWRPAPAGARKAMRMLATVAEVGWLGMYDSNAMPRDAFTFVRDLAAYDARLDDWYRLSGVERVEVHAVGGSSFFWAVRGGLDWVDGRVPARIVARLELFADSARPVRRTDARRLLARIHAGERVTPLDVASVVSGADIFAGLSWVGVRRLAAPVADVARRARVALIMRGAARDVA